MKNWVGTSVFATRFQIEQFRRKLNHAYNYAPPMSIDIELRLVKHEIDEAAIARGLIRTYPMGYGINLDTAEFLRYET